MTVIKQQPYKWRKPAHITGHASFLFELYDIKADYSEEGNEIFQLAEQLEKMAWKSRLVERDIPDRKTRQLLNFIDVWLFEVRQAQRNWIYMQFHQRMFYLLWVLKGHSEWDKIVCMMNQYNENRWN